MSGYRGELMKHMKPVVVFVVVLSLIMTACGRSGDGVASSTATPEATAVSPIKTPDPNRYIHGEEGYFNLDEAGVPVNLRVQKSGTCWLYAATVSMETGYEMIQNKEISIDPMTLLDLILGDDKKEGYFIRGANAETHGGTAFFVVHTLSNGFDGYVLDRAICITDNDRDTIKSYIQKYGALYIGIPDTDPTKKASFNGYTTINHVTDDPDDYDHAIAIIGWDDHFPKDYFVDKASQDGAWITANSRSNGEYYYVSYDTSPDFLNDTPLLLSVSDSYSGVASHDCGMSLDESIRMKGETVTANVFHEAGTLAAVGTYSIEKNQDLKIEIYDSAFQKCLYTQEVHLVDAGYQTILLDTPVEVDDYAIAIHYSDVAPVEGKGWHEDHTIFKPVSEKGESFIRIGNKWYDLHDKKTLQKIHRKHPVNNCCIKGLYAK